MLPDIEKQVAWSFNWENLLKSIIINVDCYFYYKNS
jgi:hypothetical protein